MFAVCYTFAFKDVLNFSFSLKKPPDGQWGIKKADGSWTGMMELLQTNQADIGLKNKYLSLKAQLTSILNMVTNSCD